MVEKRAKSDKMKTQMVHNNFFPERRYGSKWKRKQFRKRWVFDFILVCSKKGIDTCFKASGEDQLRGRGSQREEGIYHSKMYLRGREERNPYCPQRKSPWIGKIHRPLYCNRKEEKRMCILSRKLGERCLFSELGNQQREWNW